MALQQLVDGRGQVVELAEERCPATPVGLIKGALLLRRGAGAPGRSAGAAASL
eukprot:CAMPEP_0171245878 /NCGR_PEP_ID=MMETSP0790-20130122/47653_1 /TAXON_ID=2925 /ORGANISM="Alexandrium catenella, Strain OF101" /LENGTH=52 /DNA_ID=CAMNT_0011713163 /DNA_START=29 /DNA_END=184 /DNA_ORIENTATION=+